MVRRNFGEVTLCPAQELQEKQPQLPADIQWHFIGHVQSNKSRQLVGAPPPAPEGAGGRRARAAVITVSLSTVTVVADACAATDVVWATRWLSAAEVPGLAMVESVDSEKVRCV